MTLKKIFVVKALLIYKKNDASYFLELIRSKNKSVCPGMGDLPGGKVDEGESIENAIIREVREETGIAISHIQLITEYDWKHGNQEYREYLYYALSPTQTVIIEHQEHESYRWIPLDKLNETTLHSNLKKIIERHISDITTWGK